MKPPTLEFLEELRERARLFGWDGDYIEVANFVRALYQEAGLPKPSKEELEPYPCEDEK